MNYEIISDKTELEWFYNKVLPKTTTRENYTFSLMARKKYMENPIKGFPNSKIIEQRIMRKDSFDKLYNMLERFEVKEGAYRYHDEPILNEALIVYASIEPSDSIRAYNIHKKNLDDCLVDLLSCDSLESQEMLFKNFSDQRGGTIRSLQKARNKKYMDFDIDTPKSFLKYIKPVAKLVKSKGGRAYIIDTKNGYHLLISKDTKFDKDFNPMTIEGSLKKSFPDNSEDYEISQAKSGMIPLPGTYQGNYPVSILNKGDY